MVFLAGARDYRVRDEGFRNVRRVFNFRSICGRPRHANIVNGKIGRGGEATDFVLLVEVGRGQLNNDGYRANGLVRLRERVLLFRFAIFGERVLRHVRVRFVLGTVCANASYVNNVLSGREFIGIRHLLVRPCRRNFGIAVCRERVVNVRRRVSTERIGLVLRDRYRYLQQRDVLWLAVVDGGALSVEFLTKERDRRLVSFVSSAKDGLSARATRVRVQSWCVLGQRARVDRVVIVLSKGHFGRFRWEDAFMP